MILTALGYAFLGGILPSFIWLYFLLREDARHPEPKKLIAFAFIVGMLAVPIAIPMEQYVRANLQNNFSVMLGWATIEEVVKYAMAAIFIFWRRAVDETPDYVIYMLTVALGFAALENTLFILEPLLNGQIATSFVTGDLRFLGSTLCHVLSSATIGFALAFSERYRADARIFAAAVGLILAIALHTAFNTIIMGAGTSTTLTAFFLIWMIAVVFFAAFEVLKYFQYHNFPNPTRSS
ncbi:MAG: PrsW family glutamic-type intramembrane protease [Minisyncoccia bacterium]